MAMAAPSTMRSIVDGWFGLDSLMAGDAQGFQRLAQEAGFSVEQADAGLLGLTRARDRGKLAVRLHKMRNDKESGSRVIGLFGARRQLAGFAYVHAQESDTKRTRGEIRVITVDGIPAKAQLELTRAAIGAAKELKIEEAVVSGNTMYASPKPILTHAHSGS
jgi:hypothetical protein